MEGNILKRAFNEQTYSRDNGAFIEYWTNRRYTADQTGQTVEVNQGDYMKDGVLYCGKCDTPKTKFIAPLGANPDTAPKTDIVRCVCRCEKDAFDDYNLKVKEYDDAKYIKALRENGIPEGRMREYTFENDTDKGHNSEVAMSYVNAFEEFYPMGVGLMFYGPCGTGKTFIATAIANTLIDRMMPCKVTNLSTIANELQSADNKQAYIDSYNNYRLLVIDDFGIERDTKFMDEVVYQIINSRYIAKKPIIVTTNLTRDELNHPGRDASRIISRLCDAIPREHRIEFTGADKRMQNV